MFCSCWCLRSSDSVRCVMVRAVVRAVVLPCARCLLYSVVTTVHAAAGVFRRLDGLCDGRLEAATDNIRYLTGPLRCPPAGLLSSGGRAQQSGPAGGRPGGVCDVGGAGADSRARRAATGKSPLRHPDWSAALHPTASRRPVATQQHTAAVSRGPV